MRTLLAALLALSAAARAAPVHCPSSGDPARCRADLLAALQADPPDALVVLGAMPGACKTRAQGAAAIFRALPGNEQRRIILSGNNPHDAADLKQGAGARAVRECRALANARANSESELMCAYIRMLPAAEGVDASRLILESRSGSTRANADNSTRIAKERGVRHLLVVTTGYDRNYNQPVPPQSHACRALGDFCRARTAAGATFKLSGVDWPARGTPYWLYAVDVSCDKPAHVCDAPRAGKKSR
jgi:hypothetical protein